ncbi:Alpha/Beta hydrolase protein [Pisolithus croceorrhizus]|nr:Alpha/Beta hydrolase protein [Pisolithus croceorrhizus]KAI6101015.1 Alpha/Beta hydrolase protein [Pisolithus croceorrhizus]KAI6111772.1 Alpha/Beta hydrolase protein [Pisolithus croceorrhizus]
MIRMAGQKLLVNNFARKGYLTIAPDYLHGDPTPPYARNNPKFNVRAWTENHTEEVTWPLIHKVIRALREDGVTSFVVTGYCFGGPYAINLAICQTVDVLIVTHPSRIEGMTIFQTLADEGKAPFLLELGSEDTELSPCDQQEIDSIFGKYCHGYKRKVWDGCPHGFAVRGDMLDEQQCAGKVGHLRTVLRG